MESVIHRDYVSADRAQIRIEENQLSLWNPGGQVPGLSPDDLQQPGHPYRMRNLLLADAIHQAGLVEHWGTDTTRILHTFEDAGLPPPAFSEEAGIFRVSFQRGFFSPERLAELFARQQ